MKSLPPHRTIVIGPPCWAGQWKGRARVKTSAVFKVRATGASGRAGSTARPKPNDAGTRAGGRGRVTPSLCDARAPWSTSLLRFRRASTGRAVSARRAREQFRVRRRWRPQPHLERLRLESDNIRPARRRLGLNRDVGLDHLGSDSVPPVSCRRIRASATRSRRSTRAPRLEHRPIGRVVLPYWSKTPQNNVAARIRDGEPKCVHSRDAHPREQAPPRVRPHARPVPEATETKPTRPSRRWCESAWTSTKCWSLVDGVRMAFPL